MADTTDSPPRSKKFRTKYAKADQKFKLEYSKTFPNIIEKSKLGDLYAFCRICQSDVSVRHGGLHDIKKHIGSKKHESISKSFASTSKVSEFFCGSSDQSVIKAEVLFTEFLIEHAIPISVSDHCAKLFRKMFPDSKIATKYASARTKTSNIVLTLGQFTSEKVAEHY